MGTIVASIYNALLAILNSRVAQNLAMKYFIKAMLLVLIPFCLLKGFNYILAQVVAYQVAEMQNITDPTTGVTTAQLTGLATYLFVQLGLNIALSSIASALSFKFIVRSAQKGYGMLYYF